MEDEVIETSAFRIQGNAKLEMMLDQLFVEL